MGVIKELNILYNGVEIEEGFGIVLGDIRGRCSPGAFRAYQGLPLSGLDEADLDE